MSGLDPHDPLIGMLEFAATLVPLLAVLFVGSLAALVRPALRKAVRSRAAHRALPTFRRRRRPF